MQSRAASGIITSYLRPASPLWRLYGAKTHPQQAGAAGSTQTSAVVALPATSSPRAAHGTCGVLRRCHACRAPQVAHGLPGRARKRLHRSPPTHA